MTNQSTVQDDFAKSAKSNGSLRRARGDAPAARLKKAEHREADRIAASSLIQQIVPATADLRLVKSRIATAATMLKWSYRRAEDIWRCYAQRIEAWEMDQLRSAKQPNGGGL